MNEESDRILIERLNERVLNIIHFQERTQQEQSDFLKIFQAFMEETTKCNAELRSCLKGYGNGEGGLVQEVANNCRKLNRIDKTVWGIIVALALSGTGYGIGIFKILGG